MHRCIVSAVLAFSLATPLAAQASDSLSLDATVGQNSVYGGRRPYFNSDGVSGEVTIALRFHPDRDVASIAALSVGGRASADHGDVCAILPPPATGCAPPYPDFAHVGIVGGVEMRAAALALRVLAGPAYYGGSGRSGLGAQFDVNGAIGFTHLALVFATRGTLLRRFDGESFHGRSIEAGLRVQ